MTVLVTGCYGFLGHATCVRLLEAGHVVVGIDKVRGAISPKAERIENLKQFPQFQFEEVNLTDYGSIVALLKQHKPECVAHFAAQYSVGLNHETALQYRDANLVGYVNLMEATSIARTTRVMYASSTFVQDGKLQSSMYGMTKEFGERCGNVYVSSYGMTVVNLRFGSVYGPFMRPDAAPYQLCKKLFAKQPIDVTHGGFNYKVAFLFIDDAIECVVRALTNPLELKYSTVTVVAEDYLADLDDVLQGLEKASGLKAIRAGELAPRQGFQIPTEKCDVTRQILGYAPQTKLGVGCERLVEWWRATNR